jgi:Uncharacterized protein conserved in bacteria (DUF2059)
MIRFVCLAILASNLLYAAETSVDIDTAAKIYQAAQIREQVRASLGSMPAQIRKLYSRDGSQLSEQQLAAVTAAAERGFRIDVFEPPALAALAANLDSATETKSLAFLVSDLGQRMVAADVAAATLGEENIDKIMSGELTAPGTPKRDAVIEKLERASHAAESNVEVFLSMGQAVAVGTAIGSGQDQAAVSERARKSGESSRTELQDSMRVPMRRFLSYSYRTLSDADLKHLLAFLESPAGKRYVAAYNASMGAGYDAMGKRTGEQLGESLRELAQAQFDQLPENRAPPGIAAPTGPVTPTAPPAPDAPPAPATSPAEPH